MAEQPATDEDGAATPAELRNFANLSGVPIGLRSSYVRFAMRTVVGVAPTADKLREAFDGLNIGRLELHRMLDVPFLVASATVA